MTRTSTKTTHLLAAASALVGTWSVSQPITAQAQAPEVLACFYECKNVLTAPGVAPTAWLETTTLMIANENPPLPGHPVTHVAHMLILNGNEQPLLHTATQLTGWDLDEIHVCRTLRKANVVAPPAGLVQIAIQPLTANVYPAGVDVWIKNLLGRFPYTGDDPFVQGRVDGVGKTHCAKVPDRVAEQSAHLIMEPPGVSFAPPVLIERTADPVVTPPTVVN